MLPVVPTQTAAVGLGVTRRLGARTSLRLDARGYSANFDQADAASAGLVDGRSVRGTASLDWMIGSRDTTGIVYSLEADLDRVPPAAGEEESQSYLTHFGSLQWNHVLVLPQCDPARRRAAATRRIPPRRGSRSPGASTAVLSYNRKVKRSNVTLFARREVAPAFGLGVSRLDTRFGLIATIPMGRAWTLDLTGTHVLPETPESVDYSYSTPDEASATPGTCAWAAPSRSPPRADTAVAARRRPFPRSKDSRRPSS